MNAIDQLLRGAGAWHAHVACVAGGAHVAPVGGRDVACATHIQTGSHETEALDAELAQQAAGQRAGGHARGGLACTGALKRGATVGGEPLHAAGQIRMARARLMHGGRLRGVIEPAVAVGDAQRDRPAHGVSLHHAREHLGGIGFHALATTAAVARLAATQFAVDEGLIHRQAGGQTFDHRQHAGSVALASRDVSKRHARDDTDALRRRAAAREAPPTTTRRRPATRTRPCWRRPR